VKSGKHSTRTLSLVQNRVTFKKNKKNKKNLQRSTLEVKGGGTQKSTIFLFFSLNRVSSCFEPPLSFFSSASVAATYIFAAPTTCTTTIITLETCALNAEFQHFILRFNKNFPYFANLTERGGRE